MSMTMTELRKAIRAVDRPSCAIYFATTFTRGVYAERWVETTKARALHTTKGLPAEFIVRAVVSADGDLYIG